MKTNWPTKKLGEVTQLQMGETLIKKDLTNEGVPVYSADALDVPWGFTSNNRLIFNKGSIIIGARGTIGSVKLPMDEEFTATQTTIVLTPNTKEVNSDFLHYFLKKINLKNIRGGTGIPMLTIGHLSTVQIPLPPFPTQQKIVKILDTIQSAVEIQEKIIGKTKELKKSLMAELFKYGAPSFRKGRKLKKTGIGEIPEDWEVVRLGDVFKIVAGGDISKLNFSSTKTDKFIYPIYSNTIANNGLYGFADTYQFEGNCITVTARGTIGYAIPRFEKFNAIIRLLVLIPKINLNIIYVSEFINEKIRVAFENTSIPQLTVPRFSIFKIPLPPLPEQQEITEILQTIDQKIEIEQKKKALYEELFRTMLNKIMSQEIDVEKIEL